MSVIKLPADCRPAERYRQCELGLDLPSNFVYELRGIDEHLYPIWHAYRMLWDSVINSYSGLLEDPRYQVSYKYGHTNFGFVLTDGHGRPVEDGTWHVWRLCRPHGWAHVINLDSTEKGYLNLVLKRLYLQAQYNDRFGHKGYTKLLQEADAQRRHKLLQERKDMMNDIYKVNSSMMNRVVDNFSRGITKVTNPTKDVIISGAGISKRSKITRPITDKEGGLILPE